MANTCTAQHHRLFLIALHYWHKKEAVLTPCQWSAALAIFDHLNHQTGAAYARLNTYARKAGVSRTTVKDTIKILINHGLLSKEAQHRWNGSQCSNRLTVSDLVMACAIAKRWIGDSAREFISKLLAGEYQKPVPAPRPEPKQAPQLAQEPVIEIQQADLTQFGNLSAVFQMLDG